MPKMQGHFSAMAKDPRYGLLLTTPSIVQNLASSKLFSPPC